MGKSKSLQVIVQLLNPDASWSSHDALVRKGEEENLISSKKNINVSLLMEWEGPTCQMMWFLKQNITKSFLL